MLVVVKLPSVERIGFEGEETNEREMYKIMD